jgi:signal transduction histidine kinase
LNDILNFSKIDSGVVEVKTEPFSIKQLFDDVSDLFLIAATLCLGLTPMTSKRLMKSKLRKNEDEQNQ